jgi:hypothetical protein
LGTKMREDPLCLPRTDRLARGGDLAAQRVANASSVPSNRGRAVTGGSWWRRSRNLRSSAREKAMRCSSPELAGTLKRKELTTESRVALRATPTNENGGLPS